MNPVLGMPQTKSHKMSDLKKLCCSIQKDEENDDKLILPVRKIPSQPKNFFKIPASAYMPYRFDQCSIESTKASKVSYDTLLKLRATPIRITRLKKLLKDSFLEQLNINY